MSTQLQLERLNAQGVPDDARAWVERAIAVPLNRALESLRGLFSHGLTVREHLNAQLFTLTFTAPTGTDWTTSRLDTASTLRSACVGLQPLRARRVDASGAVLAELDGLTLPAWTEVVSGDRSGRVLRLVFQGGLTAGVRYQVTYLAWGG